jgi:hypothetical protein
MVRGNRGNCGGGDGGGVVIAKKRCAVGYLCSDSFLCLWG